MKRILFIDRDGTLVKEPQDYQIDSFEKLEFYPEVFQYLGQIARDLEYELVMVTNQDGLGTDAHPEVDFWLIQNFIIKAFEQEGIRFEAVHIDKTFPHEKRETRKPNTGLLTEYFTDKYDLENSFVIGDRITDMELAKNLGGKGIFINAETGLGKDEIKTGIDQIESVIALETTSWNEICSFLKVQPRHARVKRDTKETQITVELNLDGEGRSDVETGIPFFDHMLDQLARHGKLDLTLQTKGDLEIDEHHTIEDTALALGEAFYNALGNKLGIERYGYCLPMDDCLAQVSLDFGGRSWLVWEADFKREMIGKMPTEMFMHFFKSFSDAAKCNLNIKAEGTNEHHKIEAIFKAFAKAIRMAARRDKDHMILPSTKGVLE